MRPEDSPFPCYWWGTGLEAVGLGDDRPDVSTYGQYDFNRLPALPFELRGDFSWLAAAPSHATHIGIERAAGNAQALSMLRATTAHLGIGLPEPFDRFMRDRLLQNRVRSNTDCYLDLCPSSVPSPVGQGYLVRFLSDSQGCLFWYLYLTSDGSDHAVVSSPSFYGLEEEQWQEEPADPGTLVYCAESFEAFLCRFWLENEIWLAEYEQRPILEAGRRYIEAYRR